MKRYVRSSIQPDDWERTTYKLPGKNFSVRCKMNENDGSLLCRISEIHPYDLAEYAWITKDTPTTASIVKNGKRVKEVYLPDYDEDMYEDFYEYVDTVIDILCKALKKYNADVKPRIDHT